MKSQKKDLYKTFQNNLISLFKKHKEKICGLIIYEFDSLNDLGFLNADGVQISYDRLLESVPDKIAKEFSSLLSEYDNDDFLESIFGYTDDFRLPAVALKKNKLEFFYVEA